MQYNGAQIGKDGQMKTTSLARVEISIPAVLTLLFVLALPLQAAGENWQRKDVDWRAGGGRRIKAIRHPKDQPLPTRAERQAGAQATTRGRLKMAAVLDEMLVESPPVDGFVPWISVSITRERKAGRRASVSRIATRL